MDRLLSALLLLLVFITSNVHGQELTWSYGEGRNEWCRTAKQCCGRWQSPIDLRSQEKRVRMKPFRFHDYDLVPSSLELSNSGRTVNVAFGGEPKIQPTVSGGGMRKKYLFDSFHFHWGSEDSHGSEHTIDGQRASLELHLVHYSSNYKSLDAAKQSTNDSDAMAVIAVLFNATHTDESDVTPMATVVRALSSVEFREETGEIECGTFPLRSLLPNDVSHGFRYQGSLTTPPCTQGVVWTIFTEIMPISHAQLEAFRTLSTNTVNDLVHPLMEDNFRLEQEANGREIDEFVT